ncbi:hypothetical protein ACJX0J_012663, partial [Zea mays]
GLRTLFGMHRVGKTPVLFCSLHNSNCVRLLDLPSNAGCQEANSCYWITDPRAHCMGWQGNSNSTNDNLQNEDANDASRWPYPWWPISLVLCSLMLMEYPTEHLV